MDISYYALKPLNINGELRMPGDLVPEARDWNTLTGYLQDFRLAPVLVATLPKGAREFLALWEEEQALIAAGLDNDAITAHFAKKAEEQAEQERIEREALEEAERAQQEKSDGASVPGSGDDKGQNGGSAAKTTATNTKQKVSA